MTTETLRPGAERRAAAGFSQPAAVASVDRTAPAFVGLADAQQPGIGEARRDQLQADRHAGGREAAVYRERGLFAHIPRHGEDDVLERPLRIVQRRGPVGGEGLDLVGRRQQQVDLAEQPARRRISKVWLKPRTASTPLTRAPPSAQAWT